jgi:hypothetical protein
VVFQVFKTFSEADLYRNRIEQVSVSLGFMSGLSGEEAGWSFSVSEARQLLDWGEEFSGGFGAGGGPELSAASGDGGMGDDAGR